MRLGTKKILSLALTGALVLGGANFNSGTVKADEPVAAAPTASADTTATPAATSTPAATATPAAASATPEATATAAPTASAVVTASASPAATAVASSAPAATAAATGTPAPTAAPLPYGEVGELGEDISAPFVASLDTWGVLMAGNGQKPANKEAALSVSKFGEYQVSTIATESCVDLKAKNNSFELGLDLKSAPEGFDVIGESVKIGGTEYALDQTNARVYESNGTWKIGFSNPQSDKLWANTFTSTDSVSVNEGDIVTVKFKVVKGEYAHFGEEETVAPAPKKTTKNACKKVTVAKKVSVKRGKSKTITFKLTNKKASKKTTDKITVKSSKKKYVTAKITKKAAKKVTVKVTVKKKAKKNAKVTITLKVGKKSAKTKVIVK